MLPSRLSLLAALAVALALGAPGAAYCSEDSQTSRARALFREAHAHYKVRQFDRALKAFQGAYLAKPIPDLLFNIGQCHRSLGHHTEAIDAYRRFLAAVPRARNRDAVQRYIAFEEAARKAEEEAAAARKAEEEAAAARKAEEEAVARQAPAEAAPPAAVAKPTLAPEPAAPPPSAQALATSNPVQPPPPRATPLYKKWWLWTLVGAAVAGGVAVGVAQVIPNNASTPSGFQAVAVKWQ